MTEPLIFIVSGPGGAGKGTIVYELMARDSSLWLSKSWTTRAQREGEPGDAYVFASRQAFEERIAAGGFLEWTEFLGNLYGSPLPEVDAGRDIVLEIEVDGAQQVKQQHPEAVLLFVLPPSREEQKARLHGRGDADNKVEQRLKKAEEEEPVGKALADFVLINDDLAQTVDDMLDLIAKERVKRA